MKNLTSPRNGDRMRPCLLTSWKSPRRASRPSYRSCRPRCHRRKLSSLSDSTIWKPTTAFVSRGPVSSERSRTLCRCFCSFCNEKTELIRNDLTCSLVRVLYWIFTTTSLSINSIKRILDPMSSEWAIKTKMKHEISLTSAILERFAAERVSRLPWSQKVLGRAAPGLSNGVCFSATRRRIWGLHRPQSWLGFLAFRHCDSVCLFCLGSFNVKECVRYLRVPSMNFRFTTRSQTGGWQTRSQIETVTRFHFRPIYPQPPSGPSSADPTFVDCRDKLECHYSSTIAISANFPSRWLSFDRL